MAYKLRPLWHTNPPFFMPYDPLLLGVGVVFNLLSASLTTVCPADRPCPQIFAKILKQTKSQNPSTDAKLLTCLFATHHAQRLKTRPDPADGILCCASAGATTLNTRVKNPHRKPPPIARAHCTAHCAAHCIGTAVWQGFWVCQERVVSRGSPTGFRRLQRARLLPCLTRLTL